MTVYEYLIGKKEHAERMAAKSEEPLKTFWINAKNGFERRLDKLTVEEAGKIALLR